MRTIKFRGKRKDNGEWAYGDLTHKVKTYAKGLENVVTIFDGNFEWSEYDDFEVDPDTVGQFTGMLDMNGVEIYEGDIMLEYDDCGLVEYDEKEGQFTFTIDNYVDNFSNVNSKGLEVYGNVHDCSDLTEFQIYAPLKSRENGKEVQHE